MAGPRRACHSRDQGDWNFASVPKRVFAKGWRPHSHDDWWRDVEERKNEGVAFVLDLSQQRHAEDERKRAEDALQEAQAELAHVTRVVALGELTASIAHEIDQPLGAVVNNASACLRWLRADNLEEARQSASLVIAEGHRAGQIISRIRALAKKTPPQKDWLEINETIGEVIAMVRNGVDGIELPCRPG